MLGEVGVPSVSLLFLFLLLSAFFSGSEAAMLSVQRVRIQHLVSIGTAGAARVARMTERPEKLLPPILLGNNLVNTAVAALATTIAISAFESEGQGVLIATAAVTLVLLIFGETIPKTAAARHPERASILLAPPLEAIGWVLRPVSFLLEKISSAVSNLLGAKHGAQALITEEEIKTMISVGRQEGAVEEGEATMIRRIFEFGDRQVREIMTPRPEIVWVEAGTSIRNFLALYNESYHTRFPVCHDKLDNVVGVIAVKDVMRLLASGVDLDSSATQRVRPALFVPETKHAQHLFDEMRVSGEQLAMVVDEFGGVAGLVTVKRLVEDIVGHVSDEERNEPDEFVTLGEDRFDLDGGMSIADANDRVNLSLPLGEYDTVAGFILEQLGKVPEVETTLAYRDLWFTITEMQGVRIARVRVTREPAAPK